MSKIIALDAGHGLYTSGKRCLASLDPNQTREWYLNDRIMDKVEQMLKEGYECTVLRVGDTTGNKDIALTKRVKAANEAKADMYVSMHHNAGIYGGSGGGTVVYYYSSSSKRLTQARDMYNKIVSKTGLIGDRSQRVIKKGFYVLKHTSMPAFLIENGFMDSSVDVPIILTEEHARRTAEGVVAFLVEQLCLEPLKLSEKVIETPERATYPAYTGAKTTLANALQSLGIDGSYSFRKKLAAANNITGYRGTYAQNVQLYNLLVAGMLKKVE